MAKPSELLAAAPAASEPIPVYTGPTRTGPALIAAVAMDADKQTPPRQRGRKTHLAAKKPDAAAEPKTEPKSAAKPAVVRHANAKPDAAAPKAAEKPAATPAKPKAAAKPKPAPNKPAPKTTSEVTPADQKPRS